MNLFTNLRKGDLSEYINQFMKNLGKAALNGFLNPRKSHDQFNEIV